MNYRIGIVFFYLMLTASASAQQSNRYVIKAMRGKVLKLSIASLIWQPAAVGAEVADGDLLQVPTNGQIFLTNSKGELSSQLAITTPMIFRLSEHALRQVKLGRIFLRKPPKDGNADDSVGALSFQNAWTALMVFLSPNEPFEAEAKKIAALNETATDAAIDSPASKIQILLPVDQAFYQVSKFPTQVKVAWSKIPDKDSEYVVYVWPMSQKEKRLAAITRDPQATLTIYETNSYYVQIESRDGAWSSKPRAFYVSSTSDSKERASSTDLITLDYPPANFELVAGKGEAVEVGFAWHLTTEQDLNERLIIEGQQQLPPTQWRKGMQVAMLKPGNYTWYIQAQRQLSGRIDVISSPRRQLTIRQSDTKSAALDFRQRYEAGSQATIYLPSGL